jgi:oxygen-independent coproporphyrinogen-3 oxidase
VTRFQIYIHVPYCARRCGYCDFNTYVAPRAERAGFGDAAALEMELAARWLDSARRGGSGRAAAGTAGARLGAGGEAAALEPAASVFFGGGTPTLLPAGELVRLRGAVERIFGMAPGAEVTCEANPETVSRDYLRELADGGFTRVSFGMQSAVPRVLRVLDRAHTPERVGEAVGWALAAGLEPSVDLIYGAPGESLADWEASARAALGVGVRHISAYALTLEPHTPLARAIRAGRLEPLDPDGQAEKYELADALFEAAGLNWYEISNWAAPGHGSRHNLGYWTGAEWWGIGPGAHSAIGGERFWNAKAPRTWAARLAAGELPVAGRDRPDAAGLELERVMLRLRTADGLALVDLGEGGRAAVAQVVEDGLATVRGDRLVLTLRGRLLADTVTHMLAVL